MKTVTMAHVERARRAGDVTPNGVAFTYSTVSSQGAVFTVFREPHHDDDDLRLAARQLRSMRDVIGHVQHAIVRPPRKGP